MSRIGRMPVAIPAGVTVTIAEGNKVTVKGPKGTLERELPVELTIEEKDGHVIVSRPNDLKRMKSLHGLTRTLINNMIHGVTEGYEKVLEVNGVGYRAAKQGKKLTLNLGYSHPVEMEDPEGIETVCDGQNKIIVKGISKEKVGQYAAEIRDKRRPEPYKGKEPSDMLFIRRRLRQAASLKVRHLLLTFRHLPDRNGWVHLMPIVKYHLCRWRQSLMVKPFLLRICVVEYGYN